MRLRARGFAILLLVVTGSAACKKAGDGLAYVTVEATPAVDPIVSLRVAVSVGMQVKQFDVPLADGMATAIPPARTFAVVIPLSIGNQVIVEVEGQGQGGQMNAYGNAAGIVAAGQRTDIRVVLGQPSFILDGGAGVNFDAGAGPSDAATGGSDGGGGVSSCAGMTAAICGATRQEDCCAQRDLPTTTFNRGNSTLYPATVSAFKLDRFEVSVGRFRGFVEGGWGVQTNPPAGGAGAHPAIANSGWDPAWNTELEATTQSFRTKLLSSLRATYKTSASMDDNLPINNVSWYEAFAFCIWDGARLPTYAEYQLAAVGGDEQRRFPWSSPPSSTFVDSTVVSVGANVERVGSRSPQGDGRFGHADLVGNLDEWVLDRSSGLPVPCVDCAQMTTGSTRMLVGYSYQAPPPDFEATPLSHGASASSGNGLWGFRCAR